MKFYVMECDEWLVYAEKNKPDFNSPQCDEENRYNLPFIMLYKPQKEVN